MMGQRLEGQVAWITGGGTGIGAALAGEFARHGATVAVSGRRQDRLDAVVSQVEALGRTGLSILCDVRDDASVATAVAEVVRRAGRLDIVVANAGLGVGGRFESIALEQWQNQIDTNVIGVVSTLRHALPHVRPVKGRLVVISSVMSKVAMPKSAPYSTSKFALLGLCRSIQQELAGSGVSLTNILPGLVASELPQVDNDGQFRQEREDRRSRILTWPADRAARVMVRGVLRRKREVTITTHGKVAGFLGQHMPGLMHWIMVKFARR